MDEEAATPVAAAASTLISDGDDAQTESNNTTNMNNATAAGENEDTDSAESKPIELQLEQQQHQQQQQQSSPTSPPSSGRRSTARSSSPPNGEVTPATNGGGVSPSSSTPGKALCDEVKPGCEAVADDSGITDSVQPSDESNESNRLDDVVEEGQNDENDARGSYTVGSRESSQQSENSDSHSPSGSSSNASSTTNTPSKPQPQEGATNSSSTSNNNGESNNQTGDNNTSAASPSASPADVMKTKLFTLIEDGKWTEIGVGIARLVYSKSNGAVNTSADEETAEEDECSREEYYADEDDIEADPPVLLITSCKNNADAAQSAATAPAEDEEDEILLRTPISSDDIYQVQRETILVWSDPDLLREMAASFQCVDGCRQVLEEITAFRAFKQHQFDRLRQQTTGDNYVAPVQIDTQAAADAYHGDGEDGMVLTRSDSSGGSGSFEGGDPRLSQSSSRKSQQQFQNRQNSRGAGGQTSAMSSPWDVRRDNLVAIRQAVYNNQQRFLVFLKDFHYHMMRQQEERKKQKQKQQKKPVDEQPDSHHRSFMHQLIIVFLDCLKLRANGVLEELNELRRGSPSHTTHLTDDMTTRSAAHDSDHAAWRSLNRFDYDLFDSDAFFAVYNDCARQKEGDCLSTTTTTTVLQPQQQPDGDTAEKATATTTTSSDVNDNDNRALGVRDPSGSVISNISDVTDVSAGSSVKTDRSSKIAAWHSSIQGRDIALSDVVDVEGVKLVADILLGLLAPPFAQDADTVNFLVNNTTVDGVLDILQVGILDRYPEPLLRYLSVSNRHRRQEKEKTVQQVETEGVKFVCQRERYAKHRNPCHFPPSVMSRVHWINSLQWIRDLLPVLVEGEAGMGGATLPDYAPPLARGTMGSFELVNNFRQQTAASYTPAYSYPPGGCSILNLQCLRGKYDLIVEMLKSQYLNKMIASLQSVQHRSNQQQPNHAVHPNSGVDLELTETLTADEVDGSDWISEPTDVDTHRYVFDLSVKPIESQEEAADMHNNADAEDAASPDEGRKSVVLKLDEGDAVGEGETVTAALPAVITYTFTTLRYRLDTFLRDLIPLLYEVTCSTKGNLPPEPREEIFQLCIESGVLSIISLAYHLALGTCADELHRFYTFHQQLRQYQEKQEQQKAVSSQKIELSSEASSKKISMSLFPRDRVPESPLLPSALSPYIRHEYRTDPTLRQDDQSTSDVVSHNKSIAEILDARYNPSESSSNPCSASPLEQSDSQYMFNKYLASSTDFTAAVVDDLLAERHAAAATAEHKVTVNIEIRDRLPVEERCNALFPYGSEIISHCICVVPTAARDFLVKDMRTFSAVQAGGRGVGGAMVNMLDLRDTFPTDVANALDSDASQEDTTERPHRYSSSTKFTCQHFTVDPSRPRETADGGTTPLMCSQDEDGAAGGNEASTNTGNTTNPKVVDSVTTTDTTAEPKAREMLLPLYAYRRQPLLLLLLRSMLYCGIPSSGSDPAPKMDQGNVSQDCLTDTITYILYGLANYNNVSGENGVNGLPGLPLGIAGPGDANTDDKLVEVIKQFWFEGRERATADTTVDMMAEVDEICLDEPSVPSPTTLVVVRERDAQDTEAKPPLPSSENVDEHTDTTHQPKDIIAVYAPRIMPCTSIDLLTELCNPAAHVTCLRRVCDALHSTLKSSDNANSSSQGHESQQQQPFEKSVPQWHAPYSVSVLFACRTLTYLLRRGTVYNRIAHYKSEVPVYDEFTLNHSAGDILNLLLFSPAEYDFGRGPDQSNSERVTNCELIDTSLRGILAASTGLQRVHPFVRQFLKANVLGGLGSIVGGQLDQSGSDQNVPLKTAALRLLKELNGLSECYVTPTDSDEGRNDSKMIAKLLLRDYVSSTTDGVGGSAPNGAVATVATAVKTNTKKRQREESEDNKQQSGDEENSRTDDCAVPQDRIATADEGDTMLGWRQAITDKAHRRKTNTILHAAVMNHALTLLGEAEAEMQVFMSTQYPKKLKDFLFYFRKSYFHVQSDVPVENSEKREESSTEQSAYRYRILVCLFLFFYNVMTTQLPSLGNLSPLFGEANALLVGGSAAAATRAAEGAAQSSQLNLGKQLVYHMGRLVEFRRVLCMEYFKRQYLEPIAARLRDIQTQLGSEGEGSQSAEFNRFYNHALMTKYIDEVLGKQQQLMQQQVELVEEASGSVSRWTESVPVPPSLNDPLSPFFAVLAPIATAKMQGHNQSNNFHVLASSPPPQPLSPKTKPQQRSSGTDFLQRLIDNVTGAATAEAYHPDNQQADTASSSFVDIASLNFNLFVKKNLSGGGNTGDLPANQDTPESESEVSNTSFAFEVPGAAASAIRNNKNELTIDALNVGDDDIDRFLNLFLSTNASAATSEAPPEKYFDFFSLPTSTMQNDDNPNTRRSSCSVAGSWSHGETTSPTTVLVEHADPFETMLADFSNTADRGSHLRTAEVVPVSHGPPAALNNSSSTADSESSFFDDDDDDA